MKGKDFGATASQSLLSKALESPAAPATVVSSTVSGEPEPCPCCDTPTVRRFGALGSGERLRCAACYDDLFFGDDVEARAKAEAHVAEVVGWMFGARGQQALAEVGDLLQDTASAVAAEVSDVE